MVQGRVGPRNMVVGWCHKARHNTNVTWRHCPTPYCQRGRDCLPTQMTQIACPQLLKRHKTFGSAFKPKYHKWTKSVLYVHATCVTKGKGPTPSDETWTKVPARQLPNKELLLSHPPDNSNSTDHFPRHALTTVQIDDLEYCLEPAGFIGATGKKTSHTRVLQGRPCVTG